MVKASASVFASDFKGLRKFAQLVDKSFRAGIVLYDGEECVPFGDRMFAAPIACLWS